jgi:predicted PurR-regulated permease PerM
MQEYLPRLSEGARRWARFGVLLLVLGLLCWGAYRLRGVFTPLIAAAALAYVLNPLVTWFERRRRIPRLATVIIAFVLTGVLVIGAGVFTVAQIIAEVADFQQRLPAYVQTVSGWMAGLHARVQPPGVSTAPASQPLAASQDTWSWAAALLAQHGATLAAAARDYLGAAFANLANLISVLVLIPVFTFYFLWRFNELFAAVDRHLPAAYRDQIVLVVRTIDAAVASFFRGRLIVCLVVGASMAFGWTLVGVPYALLLGALTAVLNLVPYLSLLALPPALGLTFLAATQADQPWLWPVVLTMGVYMGVQAAESFVLSPAVEGRASGLHPLLIVVALLIGGHLAGLLGMLLAVPVASTLKALGARWLLPEIRRLASPTAAPGDSGPRP